MATTTRTALTLDAYVSTMPALQAARVRNTMNRPHRLNGVTMMREEVARTLAARDGFRVDHAAGRVYVGESFFLIRDLTATLVAFAEAVRAHDEAQAAATPVEATAPATPVEAIPAPVEGTAYGVAVALGGRTWLAWDRGESFPVTFPDKAGARAHAATLLQEFTDTMRRHGVQEVRHVLQIVPLPAIMALPPVEASDEPEAEHARRDRLESDGFLFTYVAGQWFWGDASPGFDSLTACMDDAEAPAPVEASDGNGAEIDDADDSMWPVWPGDEDASEGVLIALPDYTDASALRDYAVTTGGLYPIHLNMGRADAPLTAWVAHVAVAVLAGYRREVDRSAIVTPAAVGEAAADLRDYYRTHVAEVADAPPVAMVAQPVQQAQGRDTRRGMARCEAPGLWVVGIYTVERDPADGRWHATGDSLSGIGRAAISDHPTLADAYLSLTGEPMPGAPMVPQVAQQPQGKARPGHAKAWEAQARAAGWVRDASGAWGRPGASTLAAAIRQPAQLQQADAGASDETVTPTRPLMVEVCRAIEAAGFTAYMRAPGDTYAYIRDGERVGYVETGGLRGLCLSTCHVPNITTGTGFTMADGLVMIDLDKATLSTAFAAGPHWALSRDIAASRKWPTFEAFRKANSWGGGLKPVRLGS